MRVIGAIIFFLPILGLAQEELTVSSKEQKCQYYLNAYNQAEGAQNTSTRELQSFINSMQVKKAAYNSDEAFLKHVFYKTHKNFLRHYDEFASFKGLSNDRTYNCLTGTALYALILDQAGYSYQIIETNYHIFLLADTKQGKILFEATDAINGFVNGDEEISQRIESYKRHVSVQASNNKTYYKFKTDVYNRINLDGILGLLHYNLAVQAYNRHDLHAAVIQFTKAVNLYQSVRMEEFSRIITLTVAESKLDPSVKASYLQIIERSKTRTPVVASAQGL